MIKKLMIIIIFPFHVFSAGLVITSDTNTAVVLFLDNGTKRSDFVLTSKPYQTDAIFAGFASIQWLGKDGTIYVARINIPGSNAWRSLKITDNKIFIGGNLGSTMLGNFDGYPMYPAQ